MLKSWSDHGWTVELVRVRSSGHDYGDVVLRWYAKADRSLGGEYAVQKGVDTADSGDVRIEGIEWALRHVRAKVILRDGSVRPIKLPFFLGGIYPQDIDKIDGR